MTFALERSDIYVHNSGKFYQAGIGFDQSQGAWYVVFNWGAGIGHPWFPNGQVQVGGVFATESAALDVMNRKIRAKMSRGYVHAVTHRRGDAFPPQIARGITAYGRLENALRDHFTGSPPNASVADASQLNLTEASTVPDILAAANMTPEWMAFALGARAGLDHKRRKILRDLDQVDAEIELLDAKILSDI